MEGLFCYNTHFIITLFSVGSHHERNNKVAMYKLTSSLLVYDDDDAVSDVVHGVMCLCPAAVWKSEL